ncbi:MAG: polysaccharide pyruvyl transferase family protein [Lachnospiraceae bacterium]|nr:polysaccharide pyruvyl transferase family protein [Lachnospiraceae bacterium]
MKKIYIHGSYSTANFGDALLYALLIDSILDQQADNDTEYRIISENVSDFCQKFHPVKRVSMLKAVLSADAVICGGGGFLGEPGPDNKYWNRHCSFYHILPLYLATILKKPLAIIGTGMGPISKRSIRKKLTKIVEHARIVAVRNSESVEFLNDLHVKNTVKMHPDWVMSSGTEKYRKESSEQTNRIFLHLGTMDKENAGMIATGIKTLLESSPNYTVVIGSDSLKPQALQTCRYVYDMLRDHDVQYFEYKDPDGLIEAVEKSHYVITTKLHVGILSIRLGKSVLPLTIHPKVQRFYNQIGYDKKYINKLASLKADDFYELLSDFLSADYHVNIKEIIHQADQNQNELNMFLNQISGK